MKTLLICLFIILFSLNNYSQCNLTLSSQSLAGINTECSGYTLNATINNSIIVSGSCGKLKFTPPIIDIYKKTSTKKIENQTNLSIFPNPFYQDITLNFESHIYNFDIIIVNILGNKVFIKENNNSNQDMRIDLSNLLPGSYFLIIKSNSKTISTKKIIKLNL